MLLYIDYINQYVEQINKNIQSLIGFRNRLTHDYENISYSFFDEIIQYDLPILKKEIEKIINKK